MHLLLSVVLGTNAVAAPCGPTLVPRTASAEISIERARAVELIAPTIKRLRRVTASVKETDAPVPRNFLVTQAHQGLTDAPAMMPSLNRLVVLRDAIAGEGPVRTVYARGTEEVRTLVRAMGVVEAVAEGAHGTAELRAHAATGLGLLGTATGLLAAAPNLHGATLVVPAYVGVYGLCFLYRPVRACLRPATQAQMDLRQLHEFTTFVNEDLDVPGSTRAYGHLSLDGQVDQIYQRNFRDNTPEMLILAR